MNGSIKKIILIASGVIAALLALSAVIWLIVRPSPEEKHLRELEQAKKEMDAFVAAVEHIKVPEGPVPPLPTLSPAETREQEKVRRTVEEATREMERIRNEPPPTFYLNPQ